MLIVICMKILLSIAPLPCLLPAALNRPSAWMLVGCHCSCAMLPSIPLMHNNNKGDEVEAAEATTSSLMATTMSTLVTNEDALSG